MRFRPTSPGLTHQPPLSPTYSGGFDKVKLCTKCGRMSRDIESSPSDCCVKCGASQYVQQIVAARWIPELRVWRYLWWKVIQPGRWEVAD